MTFRISHFLTVSFLALAVQNALSADKSWVQQWSTPQMEFIAPSSPYNAVTPGRQPLWITNLMDKYLSYEPEDGPRPQGDCDPQKLQKSIMSAQDVVMRTRLFERYAGQCAAELEKTPLNTFEQAIKMSTMHYKIDENPFFHRVVFHLPDGQRLKGVLALKDSKVRPLVIVRMGIAGNIEEAFAERFFLYQLFERGLSNVLMVENMTGADYIHNNRRASFGGLEESYQNVWLGNLFRSPYQPFSKLVQSIHLMGYSMGGQSVLTTAYLARYQRNPNLFSSFLTMCPLVNTDDTFNSLFKTGWMRFPLEFWARGRFAEIKNWWPDLYKKQMGLPVRLMSAIKSQYKKPVAATLGVVEPWFVQRQKDFSSLHNLSGWDASLRNPVWIWYSKQDKIVPPELNVEKLPLANPLQINQGHHCSFPVLWDGRVLSALLNGHILGSSGLSLAEGTASFDLQGKDLETDFADVRFQDGRNVIDVDIRLAKATRTVQINLSDIGFSFRSFALTPHEKMMVRRWLSSNLNWRPSEGSDLRTTVFWPMVK